MLARAVGGVSYGCYYKYFLRLSEIARETLKIAEPTPSSSLL